MGPKISRAVSQASAREQLSDACSEREAVVVGDFLFAVVGFIGYAVPAPALIWGWWRWSTSSPRFGPPKWRASVAFCGLLIASIVGVAVLICMVHVNGLPEGDLKYSTALKWARGGFGAAGLALIASIVGKGPARLPASLASVGLMVLWIISVITY